MMYGAMNEIQTAFGAMIAVWLKGDAAFTQAFVSNLKLWTFAGMQ